jgi:hypothetical protein
MMEKTEVTEQEIEKIIIDFFEWLNDYEELGYTEKGINFYVDKYLKK